MFYDAETEKKKRKTNETYETLILGDPSRFSRKQCSDKEKKPEKLKKTTRTRKLFPGLTSTDYSLRHNSRRDYLKVNDVGDAHPSLSTSSSLIANESASTLLRVPESPLAAKSSGACVTKWSIFFDLASTRVPPPLCGVRPDSSAFLRVPSPKQSVYELLHHLSV